MARKPTKGWYVQVPPELKAEFQKLYPGRSAMRKLTIAAIEWAIKVRPTINPPTNEDRQLRTNDAPDMPSEVRPEDESRLDKSA